MAEPPLLVVPLPARLPIVCALIHALASTWGAEYRQTLTTAHMSYEDTPWGRAMVVREPESEKP